MQRRGWILTDGARLAGGALEVLAGLQTEARGLARSRIERILASLDLVPREEFEAMRSLAIRAREAQTELEARMAALEARIAELTTAARQEASTLRPKPSRSKEKPI